MTTHEGVGDAWGCMGGMGMAGVVEAEVGFNGVAGLGEGGDVVVWGKC